MRDFVLPNAALHGVYHVSVEPIDKYDLLRLVAETYGRRASKSSPDDKLVDRPIARLRRGSGPPPATRRRLDRTRSTACANSVDVGSDTPRDTCMFKNKTLLITGGTGSFGNAVLRRFLNSDFAEIRVFSRDEKKQEDMRIALNSDKVKFYIGDVREYDSVHDAMQRRRLRVPRRRAEAGAVLRVLSDGGGAHQHARRRERHARRRSSTASSAASC